MQRIASCEVPHTLSSMTHALPLLSDEIGIANYIDIPTEERRARDEASVVQTALAGCYAYRNNEPVGQCGIWRA